MSDKTSREKLATSMSKLGHEFKDDGDNESAKRMFTKAGHNVWKAANRSTGINKAIDKLTKEEVELSERNEDNKLKKDIFVVKAGKKEFDKGINFARYQPSRIADVKGHDYGIATPSDDENDFDTAGQKHAGRKTAIRTLKVAGRRALKEDSLEEGVSVVKRNHSWGRMIVVRDGNNKTFPLHPEHQAKIAALRPGESTSFKDEQKKNVTAHRTGSLIHLKDDRGDRGVAVGYHHFTESTEVTEATHEDIERRKRRIAHVLRKEHPDMPSDKRWEIADSVARGVAESRSNVIDNVIESATPVLVEVVPLDEQLAEKISHLPEHYVDLLVDLYASLNEDNQQNMVSACDDEDGINSMIDFALKNIGGNR